MADKKLKGPCSTLLGRIPCLDEFEKPEYAGCLRSISILLSLLVLLYYTFFTVDNAEIIVDERVLHLTANETLWQIKSEFPTMHLDSAERVKLEKVIYDLAHLTASFNTSETRQWSMANGTYNTAQTECSSHLALVIPFRDESMSRFRTHQLYLMLHYTIRYLIKQNVQFTVIIVNQISGKPFNRAKLLNVGYAYITKHIPSVNCFVFHDVDLIAESDHFAYYCGHQTPLHLSAWRNNQNYHTSYAKIMGGVTSFTKQQFRDVNGYSNEYWGWGAEDDDLSERVRAHYKLNSVSRPYDKHNYHIYQVEHRRDANNQPNEVRREVLANWKQRWERDGINTLEQHGWREVETQANQFYLNVTVQI